MGLVATALTPADLLTLPRPPNGRHYELSKGELVVVGNAGARHARVKRRVAKALLTYEEQFSAGEVFSASQFTLNEDTARIPDVAFVGHLKLALLPDSDAPVPFAPDLAVEVISASETASNAESKHDKRNSGSGAGPINRFPGAARLRVSGRGVFPLIRLHINRARIAANIGAPS